MSSLHPIRVEDRTKPTTTTILGVSVTTYPPLAGEFYIVSTPDFAAKRAGLEGYRQASLPLQHVFAGDDPANPVWTVVLKMANQTEVNAVKALLA